VRMKRSYTSTMSARTLAVISYVIMGILCELSSIDTPEIWR